MPFSTYIKFLPCKTRVLTKITQKLPKREVHHRLSNFLVREILLTAIQTGRQKLPEQARTSRTGKNFQFGVVARTDEVIKDTLPPTFDNVISLKLLKYNKIPPYQTKAPDYITNRSTFLHRHRHKTIFRGRFILTKNGSSSKMY